MDGEGVMVYGDGWLRLIYEVSKAATGAGWIPLVSYI